MEEEDKKEIVPDEENENIIVKDVTVNEVKPKKQRKPMTPEYKAMLVERIAHARKVKRQAHDAGVTPKRIITPDKDQKKPFFCDVCKKTYASKISLNNHNKRYHSEKQLMNIIKEKEMQNEQAKQTQAKQTQAKQTQPKPLREELKLPQTETAPTKDTENFKIVDGKNHDENKAPAKAPQAKQTQPAPVIQPPPPLVRIQPPPPPPVERKPVYTGPKMYTYEQFKEIETQNEIKKKQKEKELKAQKKNEHIQKTIENMRAGGIPTFHY